MDTKDRECTRMDKKSAINIAKRFIKELPKDLSVKKVYLFGSYTKGAGHEDSDIDIAVIFDDVKDYFSVQLLLMRIRRNIDLRIEPHPFAERDFNENDSLVCEILKKGVELDVFEH